MHWEIFISECKCWLFVALSMGRRAVCVTEGERGLESMCGSAAAEGARGLGFMDTKLAVRVWVLASGSVRPLPGFLGVPIGLCSSHIVAQNQNCRLDRPMAVQMNKTLKTWKVPGCARSHG